MDRADLIEAILCEYDWCISREEAETLADKLMRDNTTAARIAAKLMEQA